MFLRLIFCLTVLVTTVGCASGSGGGGGDSIIFQSASNGGSIRAYLAKPEGPGPFPAIILLHGCTGLERDGAGIVWRGLKSHAAILNEAGYVTLIVDSHGSRGISTEEAWSKSCRRGIGYRERTEDVYGAISYLASLAFVEKGSFGLVGFSQGGGVVMNAMAAHELDLRNQSVRAGVAFYPPCVGSYQGPYYNPILILIGDSDDITPAQDCEIRADLERYRAEQGDPRGNNLDIVVYPGVHHSFDLPLRRIESVPIGTVAPDPQAKSDARARMIAFFNEHLRN